VDPDDAGLYRFSRNDADSDWRSSAARRDHVSILVLGAAKPDELPPPLSATGRGCSERQRQSARAFRFVKDLDIRG
jgi:hypothetical protein